MEKFLCVAEKLGICSFLDIYFAKMLLKYSITSNADALMLISFCVSMYHGNGHVCFPLSSLSPENIFHGRFIELSKKIFNKVGNPSIEEWREMCFSFLVIGDGLNITPLVLDNDRLYLYYLWKSECIVADFFSKSNVLMIDDSDKDFLSFLLNKYFPTSDVLLKNDVDWQKISVATALMYRFSLVCGAPGTGKTAIIAKLLIILLHFFTSLHIVMAAPTAKAALKMSESLYLSRDILALSSKKKMCFPRSGVTLHNFLFQRDNFRNRFFCYNMCSFDCDILIIDEFSMVSLDMMSRIISVLPSHARVVFLGDPYQLFSVQPGSVLRDICEVYNFGYSVEKCREIFALTGCRVVANNSVRNYGFSSSISILYKNYRFNDASGVFKLANMIKFGNDVGVVTLLHSNSLKDVDYFLVEDFYMYQKMLKNFIDFYRDYFVCIRNHSSPDVILNVFHQSRLLCVLREGPFGVVLLNTFFEQVLKVSGLLSNDMVIDNKNYIGRPVMVLKNVPSLDLYNGDVGIILSRSLEKKDCEVYFSCVRDVSVKKIPYSFLPKHETSFFMTVHKSQGLEFLRVALILPNCVTSLLTRELLYTAVTRAKRYLVIYSTDKILQYSIRNKMDRYSGLVDRIRNIIH
ncbi:MAG: exodeoxyribonuclease V subunit RecD [Candidatus Westeberhardia cardiocondylae]|nr:exodeoxyribonuclease V subunit RecD [Candidatus Westeberhardia cardiocondylae]